MDKNSSEWLSLAKDDLDAISELIKNPNLTNIAAFHAQQCVEKCFKSILEFKKLPFLKTHNLIRLYELIKDDIEIDNEDQLTVLNELYIDSRYPGDLGLLPDGKPAMAEVISFQGYAASVYEKTLKVIALNSEETND